MRAANITRLAAMLCVILSGATLADSTRCLNHDPATVTVSGTLVRMTHPGPPNYESIKDGDKPETYLHLKLPTPICTNGTPEDGLGHALADVTEIQLNLTSAGYAALRAKVGQKVTVSGKLYAAHSGHHYSPLVLDDVNLLPPNPSLERP
jgi:Domain of unknown function (DUF4431)